MRTMCRVLQYKKAANIRKLNQANNEQRPKASKWRNNVDNDELINQYCKSIIEDLFEIRQVVHKIENWVKTDNFFLITLRYNTFSPLLDVVVAFQTVGTLKMLVNLYFNLSKPNNPVTYNLWVNNMGSDVDLLLIPIFVSYYLKTLCQVNWL